MPIFLPNKLNVKQSKYESRYRFHLLIYFSYFYDVTDPTAFEQVVVTINEQREL